MATVGVGDDIKPVNMIEYIFSIIIIIFGVGIIAFIIGNITTSLTKLQTETSARRKKLHAVSYYMKEVSAPVSLRNRVMRYYEYSLYVYFFI